jgi:hypothetical protein
MRVKRFWKVALLVICFISLCITYPFESKAFAGQKPYPPEDSPEYQGQGAELKGIDTSSYEKPAYNGPSKPVIHDKTPNEIAWEQNSEIMNTLLQSGKKSGVDAIAEKYGISKEEAKKKFKSSMRYFEQAGNQAEYADNMLYYPELGLKVAKGAGTAATIILSVIAPAAVILEAESVGVAAAGTGLTAAGIASATLKVAALTAEYGAYARGRKPNWDEINKMNNMSDGINTAMMITGTIASPPKTPIDVIAGAIGAATDAGTEKTAKALGKYAGSDKEAELARADETKLGKDIKSDQKPNVALQDCPIIVPSKIDARMYADFSVAIAKFGKRLGWLDGQDPNGPSNDPGRGVSDWNAHFQHGQHASRVSLAGLINSRMEVIKGRVSKETYRKLCSELNQIISKRGE